MRPSACQRLFEEDQRGRAPIRKCTVASCPLSTASRFRKAFTQPHWAHRRRSPSAVRRPPLLTPHAVEHRRTSPLSSSRRAMRVRPVATTPQDMPTHKTRLAQVPDEWSSRVTWLQYWRALTQYLLSPGPRLAAGLARTLQARRPQSAAASSAPPHPAVLSQHFSRCCSPTRRTPPADASSARAAAERLVAPIPGRGRRPRAAAAAPRSAATPPPARRPPRREPWPLLLVLLLLARRRQGTPALRGELWRGRRCVDALGAPAPRRNACAAGRRVRRREARRLQVRQVVCARRHALARGGGHQRRHLTQRRTDSVAGAERPPWELSVGALFLRRDEPR